MTRIVTHKDDDTKILFNHPALSGYSDCDDRIVCLSERSWEMIVTMVDSVQDIRTRVFSEYLGHERYVVATDEEFEDFTMWVSDIRTQLGGFMACNEYLERIAIALESIQADHHYIADNTAQLVTIDEILEDVSSVFGITHPLYLIYKWIKDLLPSLTLKLPVTDVFKQISEVITWRLPMLSLVGAISSSLLVLAASAVGQKIDKLLKDLQETTANIWELGGKLFDFISETWSWFDNIWKPLLDDFIPNEEGGTGGEDPDRDPGTRIAVSNIINLVPKIVLDCSSCGIGQSCTCGNGSTPVDSTYIDNDPTFEPDREEEDPPQGNETWEAYDVNKCAHLSKFLDDYAGTLRNWGGLFGFVGGLTMAVIVGLLLISVPPLGLAAIVAALSLLVTIDIGTLVFFNEIADWIEENKSDLLCELMAETSTSAMSTHLQERLDEFIDGMDMGGWPAARQRLKDACFNLVSNLALESAINNNGQSPDGYLGDDCNCEVTCGFQLYDPFSVGDDAADVIIEGNHYTILPTFQAGRWAVAFQFSVEGNPNACAIIDNIVVTDDAHTFYKTNWIECGSESGFVELDSPDFVQLEGECIHAILFQCDPNDNPNPGTQPTIEFDIIECCEPEV